MRRQAVGAAVLLAACLGLPVASAGAAPDPVTPRLTVQPQATVAGLPVVVDGSCPVLPEPEPEPEPEPPEGPGDEVELQAPVAEFPSSTDLTWAGGGTTVKLTDLGEFTAPVSIAVPADADPGEYPVTSTCGGSATYEVLDAPTLEVTPDEAVRGQTVIATGTCPAPPGAVQVLLDGVEATAVAQQPDGRLGDVALAIPGDAADGEHVVTTSCGGRDTVRVSVPEAPETPATPGGPDPAELVAVPNLAGLTAEQAATVAAASGLVLDGAGGPGTVTGQSPAAGALVPAGAAVRIDLALDEPADFPLLPAAAGGGGLLLLLLAAAPLTVHRRRLRRERRWLDGDVEVTPGGRVPLPGAQLPGSAPGLDVRIEVHRHRWPPTPGGPAP